jgi:hypothetical protein
MVLQLGSGQGANNLSLLKRKKKLLWNVTQILGLEQVL